MVIAIPASELPEDEAVYYGRLALIWANRNCVAHAYANARIAAHKAYLALGRGLSEAPNVIPIFDRSN